MSNESKTVNDIIIRLQTQPQEIIVLSCIYELDAERKDHYCDLQTSEKGDDIMVL